MTSTLRTTETVAAWRREHPRKILNLRGADLRGASLRGADLSEADLSEADLRGADLREASLREADLSEADLRGASLYKASLNGANLREADLSRADLREASLYRASLNEANLNGADLSRAHLSGNHVWQFGPIGSRRDYLVVKHGPNLDEVTTGCFHGTLAQFVAQVTETHGSNLYGQEYQAVIVCVQTLKQLCPIREAQP